MLHPARIFTLYLVIFLVFVSLFTLNPSTLSFSPAWIIVVMFFLVGLWRFKWVRFSLLFLLIPLVLVTRVQTMTPDNTSSWWNGSVGTKIQAKVIIGSEPRISGKNQIFLARSYDSSPKGNIEIYTGQFPVRHFGEIIFVSGKLLPVDQGVGANKSQGIVARMSYPEIKVIPGTSYPSQLQGYYYNTRAFLISVKDRYVSMTGQILPEPEAGLLSGIIFGTKAELSAYLISILAITGTVHIIALSGYNITIVAKGSQYLTKGLSRNLAFLVPVLGITFFVLATGLSSSVVRAAVMGIMLLLAARLGRQSDALNSVLFASCVMAFFNPYIVLYDVGFQLSFAAVTGIIFLAPAIERYFSRFGKLVGPILAGTVAAQIFSWPVIAFYFGRVSLIGVVANALILPIIPLIMLLGFIVVSLGFVSLGLAKLAGMVVWFLLFYVIKVNELLAGLKLASISYQNPSLYLVVAYFLLLLELTYLLNQKRKKREIEGT